MNFHGVCRICETTKDLELIFNEENAAIVCMLRSLAHYPIGINDRLSQYICTVCTQSLKLTYNFKSLYQMTYDKFKIMSLRNPQQNIKEMLSCNESVNPIEVAGSFTKTKIRKKRQVNIKSNCKIVEASTSISQLKNSTSTESVCSQDSKSTITGLNEVNPSMHVIGYEDGNIKEHIENRSDMVLKEETNNFNDGNGQVNSAQKVKSDERVEDSPSKSASINEEKLPTCKKCSVEFNQRTDYKYPVQNPMSQENTCQECGKISKIGYLEKNAEMHSNAESLVQIQYNNSSNRPLFEMNSSLMPPNDRSGESQLLCVSKIQNSLGCREASQNVYKCDECGKSFSKLRYLTSHKALHSNRKLHECKECRKTFIKSQSLKAHEQLHWNPDMYKCNDCGKSFGTSYSLNRHKRLHLNCCMYKCDECEKTFKREECYKKHKLQHINSDLFKCAECGKTFTSQAFLQQHMILHSNPDRYTCDDCGKSYSRLQTYRNHRTFHTNPNLHQCKECGKSFQDSQYLLKHQRLHLNPKLYKYEECGKSFIGGQLFEDHKSRHSNPNSNKCDECGQSFSRRYSLKKHKHWHMNPELYECDECGRTFRYLRYYENHKALHLNPSLHACDECDKSFIQLRSLKEHKILHLNPDLYRCEICGKSLTTSNNLKTHIARHSEQNMTSQLF